MSHRELSAEEAQAQTVKISLIGISLIGCSLLIYHFGYEDGFQDGANARTREEIKEGWD